MMSHCYIRSSGCNNECSRHTHAHTGVSTPLQAKGIFNPISSSSKPICDTAPHNARVCSSGWLGHTVCVLVWDPCGSDPGIVWSSIIYGLAGGGDRVEDPFCLRWRAHSGVGMGVTAAFVFEFAGSQGRVVSVTGRAFPGGSGGRAPNCCACNFAICQW